jgi:hypothetical protein
VPFVRGEDQNWRKGVAGGAVAGPGRRRGERFDERVAYALEHDETGCSLASNVAIAATAAAPVACSVADSGGGCCCSAG